MRGSRTNVVGVLVNDLNTSVVNAITSEITTLVRKVGMDMLIYNAVENLGSTANGGINVLKSVCDGLILVLPRIDEGYIATLEKSQVPIVLVNYWRTDTSLPVVRADNYFGAREAMRHLLQQGHQRIGFVTGSSFSGQSTERQRGYTDALREYGIGIDEKLIVQGKFSQLSGLEAGRQLLTQANPPTAIFAANDEMALGVMDAARALKLRLPEDLSIVGFDDIGAAANVHPPLTTVRQPLGQLAEAALQELLNRLNHTGQAHSTIELPSEVVIRSSTTAPAPARVAKIARVKAVAT
jgi:LacI family transcriptional regulator